MGVRLIRHPPCKACRTAHGVYFSSPLRAASLPLNQRARWRCGRICNGEKRQENTNQTGVSQWSTVADLRRLIAGVVPACLVPTPPASSPSLPLLTMHSVACCESNVKPRCYWLCLVCGLAMFDVEPAMLMDLCRWELVHYRGKWRVFCEHKATEDKKVGNVLHKYLQKNNVIICCLISLCSKRVFSPGVAWHIGCISWFVRIIWTVWLDVVFEMSLPKHFCFFFCKITN